MMCRGVACSFYWLKSAAFFLAVLGIDTCYPMGWSSHCHSSLYSPQILFLEQRKTAIFDSTLSVRGCKHLPNLQGNISST
jgi:hypothetical protein